MTTSPDSSQFHVLALHAHPDDIEIQCAGVLLRLKAAGHRVTVATMTPGDCGSATMSENEISEVRRGKAREAARLLGADYHCLEFRDLTITFDDDSRRRVTEFLRRIAADIVLTAPPIDYMHDHEITSELVRAACFNASVPNYRTRQWDPAPATAQIPWLYYVDAVEGTDRFGQTLPVDFVVDVTKEFDTKLAMLACHASQREWLRKQHGMDEYLDAMRRWCEQRGSQVGFKYGEGFRQYVGHPHPREDILSRLIGEEAVRSPEQSRPR